MISEKSAKISANGIKSRAKLSWAQYDKMLSGENYFLLVISLVVVALTIITFLSCCGARREDGKMALKRTRCASCYQDPQFADNPRRVKLLCELCRQAVCGDHRVFSCLVCHEAIDGGGVVDLLALTGGLLPRERDCSVCLIDPTLKAKSVRRMCSLCNRPVCGTHLVKSCVACRLQFQ